MSDKLISVQNVSIHQRDILVLQGINFEVHRGEFLYLIGKTGSGKSSLLKCLYADLPFTDGEIDVVGTPLKKLRKRKQLALRRKLGIIFQDFQLLTDRTVMENLVFVMKATGWKDKKKIKARAI